MPILSLNGDTYDYPDVNDTGWGQEHIDWAAAVSTNIDSLLASVLTLQSDIAAINSSLPTVGENNSGANVGGGAEIFRDKTSLNLNLRTLVGGGVVQVNEVGDTIEISATQATGITGPGASVDNNLPLWDGVNGQVLKLSDIGVDVSGNLVVPVGVIASQPSNFQDITTTGDVEIGGNLVALTPTSGTANAVWEAIQRATGASVGVRGVAISSESGAISVSNTTEVDLGITASITTSGRPVFVGLSCDNSVGAFRMSYTGVSNPVGYTFRIKRNASTVHGQEINHMYLSDMTTSNIELPFTPWFIDNPSAGTYTFTATIQGNQSSGGTLTLDDYKIFAFEL